MTALVLVDAGPLIALSKIDALPLLPALFGEVTTSQQVRDELLTGSRHGRDALEAALDQGWLRVRAAEMSGWRAHRAGIDPGEASVLQLAVMHPGSLLILNDRAARLEARARGLAMMGTAALIALCKARGLIAEVRPLLESLRLAGYHLGDEVIAAVLARVGESP